MLWPPGSHEAVEKDAVKDDGKPYRETGQEIGDDDYRDG